MSDAKCCDRCGKYYKNDVLRMDGVIASVGLVRVIRRDDRMKCSGEYDLCDKCASAFLDFMNMVPSDTGKEKSDGN